jgi:SNF2 family DNA or RNA helicase
MFITADTQHVVVPWRQDLANLIPHAHELIHRGNRLLVIPNNHDEAKVARNLGVPVPSPILTRFDWLGSSPWEIQKTTAALLVESPRAYVLNGLGTGKTRAAIYAAEYLRSHKGLGFGHCRVLICAPLSILNMVWERELFKLLPRAKVRVLHGTKDQRRQLLAEEAEFYIINHHGVSLLRDELIAKKFDIVIVDELAVFRNKGTGLWKSINAVIQGAKYVWGMTGAPTPTAPIDAWAQIKLLTPERTSKAMMRFKDQTMRQVSNFKWIARPEANDIIFEAMQPSVRFSLDDVMELPPTTYQTREIQLDPAAAKAYKLLFEKMAMITHKGETITAVNEGVLQNKLLQVACGYIYTDKRGVFELPNQARLDALYEVISETSRKLIVFVPFVHALEGIAKFLQLKKVDLKVISGATLRTARDKIFANFQDTSSPRVIVAHPACMAHGLTLTAANTIVWYTAINSLEIYQQANARIIRPSQTSKTLILHLAGTPVEKAAYKRLQERATLQGMLLELFRSQEVVY